MASKRTSSDSTKNLQVPSTKRIKHDDGNQEQQHPLFRTIRRSRSATNHNIAFCFEIESLFRKVIREEITPMFDRYLPPRSDIREGRSEPFRLLDARGKANEKHNRPSVKDEVWRLKGIEIWSSTSTSQSDLIGSEFYDQMIAMGEMQPYLPGEGNIFSEAYNFDGASQISQFGSYSLEQVNANPMPFVNGDGAGPSNHSSSLNFAVHISSNGKPKKDWQKIRSALKWFMLYTRKREQFLFIYTP
ncbi:hypothetical protein TSUD_344240 [Trifolium subterraneum]|nr:hypothetical protein TSUD_344240 [Trifolium subterraneum]